MHLKKLHIITFTIALAVAFLFVWIKFNENRTLFNQNRQTQTEDSSLSFIPLYASDPILGNKRAETTIVAFEDFLCEGCRAQHIFLKQLLAEYGDNIRVIWKDLSITQIPLSSQPHHVYGYCANEQKLFEAYQDKIFSSYISEESGLDAIVSEIGIKQNKFDDCLASGEAFDHLEKNKTIARALNIQSVPVFFVNDTQITSPQSYDAWKTTLGL